MAVGRAIVFVGPSIRGPLPQIPDLEYRPPAERGAIHRAAQEGANVIGLIDGVFGQSLAVSPAEVRMAAASGALLFGGASMGALRACECPGAMKGVGAIWQDFANGQLTDDDEVAVTFVPVTYELVAYPLVQVREAVRLASLEHPQATYELQAFLFRVRQLPFHHRSLNAIKNLAYTLLPLGVPWSRLETWLTAAAFDVKRRDAMAVINVISKELLWSANSP